MRDSQIRDDLISLDISALTREQRQQGRSGISDQVIRYWAEKHDLAVQILSDDRRSRHVRRLAEFLKNVTYSLSYMRDETRPRYYVYTDTPMLDWFLDEGRERFITLKQRCVVGAYHLLQDFIKFESESIAGMLTYSQMNFEVELATRRIQQASHVFSKLDSLGHKIVPQESVRKYEIVHYRSIEDYVFETPRISGVCNFTCFPQTQYHDEVLFLKSIVISELCFLGIRLTIMESVEHIKRGSLQYAATALDQANGFAEILHELFILLRSMPPPHFADFRNSTGDASAVQSRNYQLMETYLIGVDNRKRSIYDNDYNLKSLNRFNHPKFLSLRTVLSQIDFSDQKNSELLKMARMLDKNLLSWRGLHLGFAKAYLPPTAETGTGGTAGVPYLQRYLRNTIFDRTEVDLHLIERAFSDYPEIPDMFRVLPEIGIAPKSDLYKNAK